MHTLLHVQEMAGPPLFQNDTKLHFSLKLNDTWQNSFTGFLGIVCTSDEVSYFVVTLQMMYSPLMC